MNNRVGQNLGNYQLTNLLGQGGFAEVYLGEHIYLKTQAAIQRIVHRALHTAYVRDCAAITRQGARHDAGGGAGNQYGAGQKSQRAFC